MKIRYLKLKQWLLIALGGLLGLNVGCETELEYGCPKGIYHVKGTVTDEKGNPLEGIGVIQGPGMDNESEYAYTTGPDGRYELRLWCMPEEAAPVDFHDIDGDQHGLYRDTVVTVSAPASAFHGGDGSWNEGTADINLDVSLTEITNK